MAVVLSSGAAAKINNGESPTMPVMQVTDAKEIPSAGNGQPERWKLVLSDGIGQSQCMPTTKLAELFKTGQLSVGSVIRLKSYTVNQMGVGPDGQPRRVVILMELDKVGALPLPGATGVAALPGSGSAAARPAAAVGGTVRAPVMMGGGGGGSSHAFQPIASLNPYNNRWTIKARITSKSDIKTWNKPTGSGKLFSIDLLDEEGTEIRATFFKEAVDKWEPMLQPNGVYYFSGGKMKLANKNFTSVKNDYEITFDDKSVIEPAHEDAKIAKINFNFTKIANLAIVELNRTYDCIGVVTFVGDVASFQSKTKGTQLTKREIKIADDSGETGASISVAFWGDKAGEINVAEGQVIAVKGAKLGDFGGRSLSSWSTTSYSIEPDVPETVKLHAWWETIGSTANLTALSEGRGDGSAGTGPITQVEKRTALADVPAMHISDKPEFVIVKACPSFIKPETDKLMYPACPGQVPGNDGKMRTCNKKMMQNGDGYTCERCPDQTVPVFRYIMNMKLQDHTGELFVTAFDEVARELLEHTANEVHELANDEPQLTAVVKKPLYRQLLFTLMCKMDVVKDEQKLKVTVHKVRAIDWAKESAALQEAIAKYEGRADIVMGGQ